MKFGGPNSAGTGTEAGVGDGLADGFGDGAGFEWCGAGCFLAAVACVVVMPGSGATDWAGIAGKLIFADGFADGDALIEMVPAVGVLASCTWGAPALAVWGWKPTSAATCGLPDLVSTNAAATTPASTSGAAPNSKTFFSVLRLVSPQARSSSPLPALDASGPAAGTYPPGCCAACQPMLGPVPGGGTQPGTPLGGGSWGDPPVPYAGPLPNEPAPKVGGVAFWPSPCSPLPGLSRLLTIAPTLPECTLV